MIYLLLSQLKTLFSKFFKMGTKEFQLGYRLTQALGKSTLINASEHRLNYHFVREGLFKVILASKFFENF